MNNIKSTDIYGVVQNQRIHLRPFACHRLTNSTNPYIHTYIHKIMVNYFKKET